MYSLSLSMSICCSIILLFLLSPYSESKSNYGVNNSTNITYEFCPPTTCGGNGPEIRFPFRLKTQPVFCGLEGFELSCSNKNTLLHLPSFNSSTSDFYVQEISYLHSSIAITDPNETTCPIKTLLSLKFTSFESPFLKFAYDNWAFATVNCTESVQNSRLYRAGAPVRPIDCISDDKFFVYLISAFPKMEVLPPNCSILSRSKWIPGLKNNVTNFLETRRMVLAWEALGGCHTCEESGNYCGFNFTKNSTICVENKVVADPIPISVIIGTSIGGTIFFTLVILCIHKYKTTKMTVDNVEKFLYNQQFWMPKRYSFIEIIAITNHFGDKLGQGGFGSVYKGQLLNGTLVAVKVLANSKFSGEEFINEVSTIGRIHHTNVVRLLGFCSEGSKRSLVYEHMPNGSLDRHIFSKKGNDQAFRWERLHEIALGTARGIEYLHNGCDVCILHFDIKPHNILLDHNFIPKVADFGLAKFHPKENDFICMSATRGTIGYIAPELISRNFGIVSCKSDVYSFGMLLLEMAGGRRNSFAKATRSSKAYFPSWVYDQMIKGGDLELRNVSEIEGVIARKLCIIGLWCIQVKATDRPSITKVMEMLEGSIDDLQMPPKPFFSSSSSSKQSSIREIQSDSSTELLEPESIEECSNADTYDV